jgi:heterodisulfide reductase subunit B2
VELSYYPGCSLHGTAEEYDQSIREVFAKLEVKLHEIPDWTCCGASSAHALGGELADLLAARNLVLAQRDGRDLLVPCAACYSRLKFAEKSHDPSVRSALRTIDGDPVDVVHIHEFLARPALLELLREKVTRPLEGLKLVPYYGCLTVRPPKVVDSESPEQPMALDKIIQTLGATAVPWSFKTDCCGGSFSLSKPEVVVKLSGDLMAAAKHAGADGFVTDCPMCQANLDTRQKEIAATLGNTTSMPIFYITELIALALGLPKTSHWLAKHLVDPRPILSDRGLA